MMTMAAMLADGFFAAVASTGFASIANPPRIVLIMVGVLAATGHMGRFVLLHQGLGMASASLCAALLISLCSLPCAKRWHIPAELFAFPALLPMIPGTYAYKTILATMQFLAADVLSRQQELLVSIINNGLSTLFIMAALVIGAVTPIFSSTGSRPLSAV